MIRDEQIIGTLLAVPGLQMAVQEDLFAVVGRHSNVLA
jgi:hypothetical protein